MLIGSETSVMNVASFISKIINLKRKEMAICLANKLLTVCFKSVKTFHTLRTSNFFFRKIKSELLEISKRRKL
jgi:hypothetical protein